MPLDPLSVVEICAGAGGQSLGLHKAGFRHELAVELDATAADTLRQNLRVPVAVGDVADSAVWSPSEHVGTSLLAGGVPCPPFSVAGRQLGSSDERDLFAWAIEQAAVIQPRAIMLENVRGLAAPRFSGYRQRVLDRLDSMGYVAEWKLILAADFGVPQLRPRFVLVALRAEDHDYFSWPEPLVMPRQTVGAALHDLMAADGWEYADEWRQLADDVGPTLVGGSKRHGGADLGPTRAKEAWSRLFVDGRGVADAAPSSTAPSATQAMPRLTIDMTARIQGWTSSDRWQFSGRKTAQYRQIGNAFPPPVALAIGTSIADALRRRASPRTRRDTDRTLHDPVYRALATSKVPLTMADLTRAQNENSLAAVERQLANLRHDFVLETETGPDGQETYRLGAFKGFTGQEEHSRHQYLVTNRAQVS